MMDLNASKTIKRKRLLTNLLVKGGGIDAVEVLSKSQVEELLIDTFRTNSTAFDEYQEATFAIGSIEDDMACFMRGDLRSAEERIEVEKKKAKLKLKKELCFIVEWGVTAGYFSNVSEMIELLYNTDGIKHISLIQEYLFFKEDINITEEDEIKIFYERFLRVVGFTCRMFDFKYFMV